MTQKSSLNDQEKTTEKPGIIVTRKTWTKTVRDRRKNERKDRIKYREDGTEVLQTQRNLAETMESIERMAATVEKNEVKTQITITT